MVTGQNPITTTATRPAVTRSTGSGAPSWITQGRPERYRTTSPARGTTSVAAHSAVSVSGRTTNPGATLHQLPRQLARARTTEVLELADLADRRHHKVRTLSGGMRRRLEIARALLHQPRVLFLDEPTTGLDPHARARIWHHLTQLRDRTGTTLYVTTHYLEEAEHCDRAAVIDHGRIVAVGTPADLKAQIGEDRIRLHTDNDTAAVAALRDLGLRSARTGDGLTLRVADSARTVPLVVAALADRQLALRALTVTPPSLDEVFFHHTGHGTNTGTGTGTDPLEPK
ncbi:ATP-binding cassette domain-containing protein [Streptomyces sp. RK75]|nr:ATP-binding cassette domain-containing protein [Streptomyces sp. RK75]